MPLTQEQLDALDKLLATSPQLKQVAPTAYGNLENAVGQAVTQLAPEMHKWAEAHTADLKITKDDIINDVVTATLTAVVDVIVVSILAVAPQKVPGAAQISQANVRAIAKERLTQAANKLG